jgi:hypothetical protein
MFTDRQIIEVQNYGSLGGGGTVLIVYASAINSKGALAGPLTVNVKTRVK